jgi:hypothetical protein
MVAFASRFGVRGNRMDIGVGVGHGSAYILFALLSHVSAGKAVMVTAGDATRWGPAIHSQSGQALRGDERLCTREPGHCLPGQCAVCGREAKASRQQAGGKTADTA